MEFKFKKHLKDLKRSRVGVHYNPEVSMFLHRNERVAPYDPSVVRLLSERLAKVHYNLYPDLELFYKKLSQWLGTPEDQIFVTEGVSGAIKSLLETLTEEGNNIVFPTPTFALYPVYCQMFNLEYRTVGYTGDYKLDLDALFRSIDENTAIVFLPNPNVPIEGTLKLDEISSLAERCGKKNAFLAIDEVYFGFGGPTAVDLISRFDNVLVMRSFSKAFGLAGIRVGYLLGSRENIGYISKIRTGYETSSVAAEIALFFMDNYKLVEQYIKEVKEGLAYLKDEFKKRQIEYDGGRTSNFIFANLRNKALVDGISRELKAKDIYIRSGWPEPFAGGFSLTAGPKPLMKRFTGEFFPILDKLRDGC